MIKLDNVDYIILYLDKQHKTSLKILFPHATEFIVIPKNENVSFKNNNWLLTDIIKTNKL